MHLLKKRPGLIEIDQTAQTWACHNCTVWNSSVRNPHQCPHCGHARKRATYRSGGSPVPQAVAIQQCRLLHLSYVHWPEDFGDRQGAYIIKQDPPPRNGKENDEMRLLLEHGWVRVEPGHYQREIIPQRIQTVGV